MRLTWAGRGDSVLRDPTTGRWHFGARVPAAHAPLSDGNLLLHAEAYDALAALRPTHAGRFRLCYINPPFNTGQDFGTYEDRASHEVWLSALEERVRLATELLAPGGFFVAHINVVEMAYLKVVLDEIFGRDRLLAQVSWQRAPDRTVLGQGSTLVTDLVEYLLVYGDPPKDWPRPQRRTPMPDKTLGTYGRVLEPSPNATLETTFTDKSGGEVKIFRHDAYTIRKAELPADHPRAFRLTNQQEESTFQQELLGRMPARDVLYRAEFVQRRGKHAGPRARHYLNGQVVLWLRDVAALENGALVRVADLNNFWPDDEIPSTGIAGEGGARMRRGKKPERLLERIVGAFSKPGDWVLDFFAGSGTTGAACERLGRRWVLVEAGAAALGLAEPRLRRAGATFGVRVV